MGNKPTSEIEARWQEEEEGETLYCQRHDWVTVGTFNSEQKLRGKIGYMHTVTILEAIYHHLRIRRQKTKDWKLEILTVLKRSEVNNSSLSGHWMYRLDAVIVKQGTQKRAATGCILVRGLIDASRPMHARHMGLLEAVLQLDWKPPAQPQALSPATSAT